MAVVSIYRYREDRCYGIDKAPPSEKTEEKRDLERGEGVERERGEEGERDRLIVSTSCGCLVYFVATVHYTDNIQVYVNASIIASKGKPSLFPFFSFSSFSSFFFFLLLLLLLTC